MSVASVFATIKVFFNEEEAAIENGVGEIHAVVTNLARRVADLEASLKARVELVGAAVTQPAAVVEEILAGSQQAADALAAQAEQVSKPVV